MDSSEELLQVMESEDIRQKIVEGRRRQNAAAARNEIRDDKDKARRDSTRSKVNPDWKKSSGASPNGIGFCGTCLVCNKRGHCQRECPTGTKGDKET